MGLFTLDIGATPIDGGVRFRVWAPSATSVEVELVDAGAKKIPLRRDGQYFQGSAPAAAGDRYWYWLDKAVRRPDPASRSQPDGVHGPSQVIDPAFAWSDSEWRGPALEECIFYELHVGTFTPQGTFDGVTSRLDYLCELGATAVELMPVAQFPGNRNWGYDGVYPFAPQNSYGGPDGLKRLVDACHSMGVAVILDVVYNHLGPEGNYLHSFGPYFTDRYRTPWGDAVNFDGPDSDPVRCYFISNALYWITEYHIDGLRLDAIHGIYDFSALHILRELAGAVHRQGAALGRRVQRRRHGSSSAEHPPCRLVVFSQNHDQVGNRIRGERPGEHLSLQQLMLAAATVLLSPYLPLLFMGEEYGESAPFPYFMSHGDTELLEAVRQGRLEEFAALAPQGSPPDPQAEETFISAKLDQELRHQGNHRVIFDFYRELIRLRKEIAPLAALSREDMQVVAFEEESVLAVTRSAGNGQLISLVNYSDQSRVIRPPLFSGKLQILLDSTGNFPPGSCVTVNTACPETFPTLTPFGVIVYRKEK